MNKITFQITEKDVEQFAFISGDYNPIHLDIDIAKQAGFTNKISHGMLTVAKILSVLSNETLTHNEFISLYEFTFLAPVYVGDQLTLSIKQTEHEIRVKGKCGENIVIRGNISLIQDHKF